MPFWILSTRQKLRHTTVNIPTMFHEVWWKKSNFFKNPPFFYFHGNCGKVCPTDSDLFDLFRSTRCGCDRKHYCKTMWILEWIKKNCTLVTMVTAAILNVFNPQELPATTVDIPTTFHEVWWKESKTFVNPPFFVSMATVAKFVQQIPIFLAYLVPLDVDVVPIKFHQFLFGE